MQRNCYQRAVTHGACLFRVVLYCVGFGILGVLAYPGAAKPDPASGPRAETQDILSRRITNYDNGEKPLIPTLIDLAAQYKLPMGIEKVTPTALQKPVRCGLKAGSLADLLDACVRQLPDYHWAVHEGTVDIYGKEEWENRLNLFNYVVPNLEVKGGDLNLVNALLRMSVPDEAMFPPIKPFPAHGGTFGDSPGVGSLEPTHIDFLAHQQTVRTILNRVVALSKGQVIWIARVPPSALPYKPKQGLWLLFPPQIGVVPELGFPLHNHGGETRKPAR
jgi:hypothetical protein